MLQAVVRGVGSEPYCDSHLAQHTKTVNHYLSSEGAQWTGMAKSEPSSFSILQQQFEADMNSSFWRAFSAVQSTHQGSRVFSGAQAAWSTSSAYSLPGFGNVRRAIKRRPRAERLSQNPSQLELYLHDSVQGAAIGDLWSRVSSTGSSIANPDCLSVDLSHDMPDQLNSNCLGFHSENELLDKTNIRGHANISEPTGLQEQVPGVPDYRPGDSGACTAVETFFAGCDAISIVDMSPKCAGAASKLQDDPMLETPIAVHTPPRPSAAVPPGKEQLHDAATSSFVGGELKAYVWPSLADGKLARPLVLEPLDLKVPQHRKFFQVVLYGFVGCLLILPLLWLAQQAVLSTIWKERSPQMNMLRQSACLLFIPTFLFCAFQPTQRAWRSLLHFRHDELEASFMAWFNVSKVSMDSLFHSIWFVVGACIWIRVQHSHGAAQELPTLPTWLATFGMICPMLPSACVMFLQCYGYSRCREHLLVCCKICSALFTGGMMYMNHVLPSSVDQALSMPFVALAQLTTTAFVQVRLSVFLPVQLLHVMLALIGMGLQDSVLHAVQLLGFGICLPALLLYSMELYARRSFAVTLKPKVKKDWHSSGHAY